MHLEALKSACAPEHGDGWLSTGDAVTAMLWRSLTRARQRAGIPAGNSAVLAIAVDGRAREPDGRMTGGQYFGNFNVGVVATPAADDLVCGDLRAAAQLVRGAVVTQTTAAHIVAKVALLEGIWPVERIMPTFDVMMTNWTKFALTGPEMDFGWGSPLAATHGEASRPAGSLTVLQVEEGQKLIIEIEVEAADLFKKDEDVLKYSELIV